MKNLVFIFIILIGNASIAQTLKVEGIYNHQRLYVQNPFTEEGQACTDSVTVNGKLLVVKNEASAYEINLEACNLELNDSVTIKIHHKSDCKVKILNQDVFPPLNGRIKFENVELSDEKIISANIKGSGRLFYHVQQYRWNKWISVSESEMIDLPQEVEADLSGTIHSGENKFRIVVTQKPSGKRYYSKAVYWNAQKEHPDYSYDREKQELVFSQTTQYEIYDAWGNIVKKGVDEWVDLHDLKPGPYYVNYDNQTGKFLIKPPKKKKK